MTAEALQSVERIKTMIRENEYRLLLAKVAVYHLKDYVKNKTELYKKVNAILLAQQLKPVSFNFIVTNV